MSHGSVAPNENVNAPTITLIDVTRTGLGVYRGIRGTSLTRKSPPPRTTVGPWG